MSARHPARLPTFRHARVVAFAALLASVAACSTDQDASADDRWRYQTEALPPAPDAREAEAPMRVATMPAPEPSADGASGEGMGTEHYVPIEEHGFVSAVDRPRSTFSVDVDTASYSIVRRYLRQGQRPPTDAIRIEELINYFPYRYPAPESGAVGAHVEVADAPWAPHHRLVRVGVQAKEVRASERPPSNLVFLVDVSGSMGQRNKLPLLKDALGMLVESLDERDRVSIVTYAGGAQVVLEPTAVEGGGWFGRDPIMRAISSLSAGGGTHGSAGIELAYDMAREGFIEGGVNRVVLATDGDFNIGTTSPGDLLREVKRRAGDGIELTVLGLGMGNYKDSTLELLADKGNGNYAYIDDRREAQKVLVEQMTSTLVTVARDVKLQVEMNPTRVRAYRLIGYENRALADEDFLDDRKDAGDVGAGHSVTALYEVVLQGDPEGVEEGVDIAPRTMPLRYQSNRSLRDPAFGDELLTVSIRYKVPGEHESRGFAVAARDDGQSIERASEEMRFCASVAAFGMLLRKSPHAGDASWRMVDGLARSGTDGSAHREGFLELVAIAARM